MSDEFDYKFELLKQEIGNLQSGVRAYDGILFTVKGWAITIFSAFIVFAIDKDNSVLFAFCAAAIVLFWMADAVFKGFQRVYIRRYNEIEKFLKGPEFTDAVAKRSFAGFDVPAFGVGFKRTKKEWFAGYWMEMIQLDNNFIYVAMLILTASIAIVFMV
jgi:hypothetical protein